MKYAMVLENIVIDIVVSKEKPSYPPDINGNPVTAIQCNDDVQLGMWYNAQTGNFTQYIPPKPELTMEERLAQLEQQNLTLMEALVDLYEQQQEANLANMEANATIFEEIMALKGGDAVVQDGQAIGKKTDKKGK